MSKPSIIVFALAAAFGAPALVAQDEAPAQDKQVLRYQPTKGAKEQRALSRTFVTTVAPEGEEQVTTIDVVEYIEVEVLAVSEAELEIGYTVKRALGKFDLGPMVVEFDTDKPDAMPPMMEHSVALIDQQLVVRMTSRGEFLEMTVPQHLKDLPGGEDLETEMGKTLALLTPELPEQAVAVEESWKVAESIGVPMAGDIKCSSTFALRGLEDGVVTLAATMEFEEGSGFDGQEVTWKVDLSKGLTSHLMRLFHGEGEGRGTKMTMSSKTVVGPLPAEPAKSEGHDQGGERAEGEGHDEDAEGSEAERQD